MLMKTNNTVTRAFNKCLLSRSKNFFSIFQNKKCMQLDVLNFQKMSALDCSQHILKFLLNFGLVFFLISCSYEKRECMFQNKSRTQIWQLQLQETVSYVLRTLWSLIMEKVYLFQGCTSTKRIQESLTTMSSGGFCAYLFDKAKMTVSINVDPT